jgi:predicted HTH domain antitoxin
MALLFAPFGILKENPYLCVVHKIKNMEKQIAILYPESLAFSLKMESREFQREIKTVSVLKLYELGKVSSGIAAKILGMSRLEFLDILSFYNISYFAISEEIENDFANA